MAKPTTVSIKFEPQPPSTEDIANALEATAANYLAAANAVRAGAE